MNAIASQPDQTLPPEFLEFWAKYESTFPGLANGSQIEDLCKEIALEAWLASQNTLKTQKEIALEAWLASRNAKLAPAEPPL